MKRYVSSIFFTLCVLSLLTACGSARTVVNDGGGKAAQNADMLYKQRVVAGFQTQPFLTARLGVQVKIGGKSVSCNGLLRMKRDDVVQLSLTIPLLGTEVGRLECTPTEVLLVDRFNKQYIRGSYEEVGFLSQTGLDFYAFQSMLWDELFVPGTRDVNTALSRFHLSQSGQHTSLLLTDAPRLEYSFLTLTEQAVVDRVSIHSKQAAEKGELVCTYGGFEKLDGKLFPTSVKLDVRDMGTDLSLALSLSRLNHDSAWETRTTVSEKYRRLQTRDIFGQLSKIGF